ncbi:iron ABC transporter ATP-binding protein, partial [Candidatus Aerophobetes bacterium]
MILKVDGVEFSYNSTPVLKEVKFEIAEGEVIAILGPNGAGKSTLLKCMNGVLKPKKGVIMIENLPVDLIET